MSDYDRCLWWRVQGVPKGTGTFQSLMIKKLSSKTAVWQDFNRHSTTPKNNLFQNAVLDVHETWEIFSSV